MAPKPDYNPNPYSVENELSTGERQELDSRWAGGVEPPAIADFEAFETWTHRQIADALSGANTNGINNTATAWRGIYSKGNEAFDDFDKGMQASIAENWQGASGQAAAAAVKDYTDQAKQLLVSILMVANDLDRTESVIDEAQKRVGTPAEDRSSGSNAAVAEAAAEAEAEARRVMLSFYQPGVAEVDSRTPRLPEPQPVGGAPSAGGSTGVGSTSGGSGGGDPAAGGGGAGAGGASDAATRAASTTSMPSGSAGGGTSGASGAGAASGSAGSASSGATTAGLAGGAAGALASAAPALGGPVSRGTAAASVVAAAPAPAGTTRGMAPMGGMYPPMGRGRGEDDDKREPNQYLVAASNASELVGELPMTTQPVIGE